MQTLPKRATSPFLFFFFLRHHLSLSSISREAADIRPSDVCSRIPPPLFRLSSRCSPFLIPSPIRIALYRRSLAPTTPPLPPSLLLPHAHSSCFTQRWRQLWSHCFLAVFLGLCCLCFERVPASSPRPLDLKTPVSNTLITRSD